MKTMIIISIIGETCSFVSLRPDFRFDHGEMYTDY